VRPWEPRHEADCETRARWWTPRRRPGEATLKRLQERFQPHLTEKAAAEFMLDRIHESYNNYRTNLYDAFQKMQNGIPY